MPLHSETQANSTKKTQALPLFGKRGKYKYTSVAVEVKSKNPVIPPAHGNKSDEEEIEEVEEQETIGEGTSNPEHNITPSNNECINEPSTSTRSVTMPPPKPIIETEEKPKVARAEVEDRTVVPDNDVEDDAKTSATADSNNSSSSSSNSITTKKKRNRIRIRTDKSRENVDFDEEMVDTEKYSTWVPPQGQSGDGNTDLNVKYGY